MLFSNKNGVNQPRKYSSYTEERVRNLIGHVTLPHLPPASLLFTKVTKDSVRLIYRQV